MSLCGIEPSNKKQRTTDQVTSCTILQDDKTAQDTRAARREGLLQAPPGQGAHTDLPPSCNTQPPSSLYVKPREKHL